MGEASQINEGSVGPPEKKVFNPKQNQLLTKELVIEKLKKLWEKIVFLLGAGMKRIVIVQQPDGKEVARIPLTLAIIVVLVSQLLLLPAAAVMVVFYKWKISLEGPKPPAHPPGDPANNEQPGVPPPPAASANESGYSEPTLPPMPT